MFGMYSSIWELKNILLNNPQFKEIQRGIKKFFEMNENENLPSQSLLKKLKQYLMQIHSINELRFYIKILQMGEQVTPKVSRRKEIKKIRVEQWNRKQKKSRGKSMKQKLVLSEAQ